MIIGIAAEDFPICSGLKRAGKELLKTSVELRAFKGKPDRWTAGAVMVWAVPEIGSKVAYPSGADQGCAAVADSVARGRWQGFERPAARRQRWDTDRPAPV